MPLRSFRIGLVGVVALAFAAGCTATSEEPAITADTADLVGRIAGSTIASPNAKASATYLSARRIDTLETIGALTGVLADMASRVDGIIANQPADGRFSVQELLTIEKPGFVETLFPEEKATLGKLWELLETTNGAPQGVALPALATLTAVDVSTPAGLPVKPAKLTIASLPAALQPAAQRLQLTRNDDFDAATVTEADLDGAIAQPGPYTPAEVASFEAIKLLFLERAGTALKARVEVSDPVASSTVVATWGGATLRFDQTVSYTERRSATFHDRSTDSHLSVDLTGRLQRQARVELPANHTLVVIDETTEREAVSKGGALEAEAGAATVEVWSGGVRQGSFRANLPLLKSLDEKKPLAEFSDYQFVGTSGAPLFRNVAEAQNRRDSWSRGSWATWTFDATQKPMPASADASALPILATPTLTVAPGRYEVPAGAAGNLLVDLYPEGVMRVTRPNGQTARGRLYIWTYAKTDAQFPDRLRALYDARTNEMSVFFDGSSTLFRGPLTGAMRKG